MDSVYKRYFELGSLRMSFLRRHRMEGLPRQLIRASNTSFVCEPARVALVGNDA